MGKEQDLHNSIFSLPKEKLDDVRGNPSKVLELIDSFPDWFMTIGQEKGAVIINEIHKSNAKVMVELGGYVGYSAILFGNEIRKNNGKFYSFEVSPEFAKIAGDFIELAGLSESVEVIVGSASKTLSKFQNKLAEDGFTNTARPIDFAFIDHWKELYVPDLRLLETLNLLGIGSVVAADNIIVPGAPEYHKYINLTPQEKSEYNRTVPNPNGDSYVGKWNFLYQSELVKVDQDAVEISKLTEVLSA